MKVETPVLSRLGPVPFWKGERKCLDQLEELYRKAAQCAEARLLRERHSDEQTRESGGVKVSRE